MRHGFVLVGGEEGVVLCFFCGKRRPAFPATQTMENWQAAEKGYICE